MEDRRNSIRNRLARLTRRTQTVSLQALETADGGVTTDANDMAQQLLTHWARVFGAADPDPEAFRRWFALADAWNVPSINRPAAAWRVRRRDVARALRLAGNSRPGPDGVPFAAWRRLGDLGLDVLFGVARRLERGLDPTREVHLRFNVALMVCLPKSPTRHDDEGRGIFKPEETRPLTITN